MAAGDLTLLDTDTRGSGAITRVWGDGTFVYGACDGDGF